MPLMAKMLYRLICVQTLCFKILFSGFSGENADVQPDCAVRFRRSENLVNILIHKGFGDESAFYKQQKLVGQRFHFNA